VRGMDECVRCTCVCVCVRAVKCEEPLRTYQKLAGVHRGTERFFRHLAIEISENLFQHCEGEFEIGTQVKAKQTALFRFSSKSDRKPCIFDPLFHQFGDPIA